MLDSFNNNSIKRAVLEKIKRGDIKKIAKGVFTFSNFLAILGLILAFLFVVFLISFIIFALQVSDVWYLPKFGFRGLELLLTNLPWLLICLSLFLIIVIEIMASHYGFVYRRPLIYSIVIIIFIVLIISFLLRQTFIHETIYQSIKGPSQDIARKFYDEYTKPKSEYFHPGTVFSVNENGFTLELSDRSIIFVKTSDKTQMPKGFKIYKGGRLLIIGKITDNILLAEAIDNAPPSGRP